MDIQYKVLFLLLASLPPTQMPCFLLIPFLRHPVLQKPYLWVTFSFPCTVLQTPSFTGRCGIFPGGRLAKATRPLTCTYFDPCFSPRFPLLFGCPAHPCQQGYGLFSPIRPKQDRKGARRPVIHFSQTRAQIATRTDRILLHFQK